MHREATPASHMHSVPMRPAYRWEPPHPATYPPIGTHLENFQPPLRDPIGTLPPVPLVPDLSAAIRGQRLSCDFPQQPTSATTDHRANISESVHEGSVHIVDVSTGNTNADTSCF
ncbi:MAG: hypothetical protein AAF502_25590 [Bacteroidota bacterium]